ncbi:MAG: OmpA family protein [Brachymonas sp.]|nr:OmpA family protein [Brachymonas sp.]
MKKTLTSLTIVSTAAALMAGCAAPQTTGQGVGAGAAIGALAGAAIGQAAGKDTKSTLIGAAAGAALGAGGGYVWSTRMQQQKVAMEQVAQGTPVQVVQTTDNRLRINIPADASFAVGSAVLNPNMYPILDRLAQTLLQNPAATVAITGHTDSTGTDAINNPLSINRANAARNYLVSRGVPAARISTAGMGSTQPVASNATEAGRAQNRRVEIIVAETVPVQ